MDKTNSTTNPTNHRKRKKSSWFLPSSSASANTTRSTSNQKRYGASVQNPKRGGPGFLLTCETGREVKCRREGLEMLHYYYYCRHTGTDATGNNISDAATTTYEEKQTTEPILDRSPNEESISVTRAKPDGPQTNLSLDEELEVLRTERREGKPQDAVFTEFQTGCRGCIFLLKVDPTPSPPVTLDANTSTSELTHDARTITSSTTTATDIQSPPTITNSANEITQPLDSNVTESISRPVSAVHMAEDEVATSSAIIWDPLPLVSQIFQDCLEENQHKHAGIPSSRFIARIIPIQRTCFAALDDIRQTVNLLQSRIIQSGSYKTRNVDTTPTTFAVQAKRRNCSTLSRQDIIGAVAEQVQQTAKRFTGREWKVDLKGAEYTFVIEICKSLCGVSIVPRSLLTITPHFNFAELRTKSLESRKDGDSSDNSNH